MLLNADLCVQKNIEKLSLGVSKQMRKLWTIAEHRELVRTKLSYKYKYDVEFYKNFCYIQSVAQSRPETKLKRNSSLRETWSKPEHIARKSAASKLISNTPEAKERTRQQLKSYWHDPVRREQLSNSIRQRMNTPEAKEFVRRVSHFRM